MVSIAGDTLMNPADLEFHFDFGSPNAYLSHRVLPQIEARRNVKFSYLPVLIGGVFKLTNNVSPMVANRDILNKKEYAQIETNRFLLRHGIDNFRMNPHFPVNTLRIMRGAVYAAQQGFGAHYIDVVFAAMWEQGRNLAEEREILAVLDAAGLPAGEILQRCDDPAIKQRLMDNTADSVRRGAFGSPFFFVGGQIFFGKDKLDDVERELQNLQARGT